MIANWNQNFSHKSAFPIAMKTSIKHDPFLKPNVVFVLKNNKAQKKNDETRMAAS